MNSMRDVLRENLEYQLKKSGLTQKQLAEKLGISPSAVTNWVKGKNSPDIEYIALMCDIFNIDISDLLYFEQTKKAPAVNIGESDLKKERLLQNYENMNQWGKDKLVEYSDDLADNPKYAKNSAEIVAKKQA